MDQEVQQLINELDAAINEITNAVTNFPEHKRDEALSGKWSLKDVMAHYCGWNLLKKKELGMLQKGKPVDTWIGDNNIDSFNKYEVEKRQKNSWDDLLSEFIETWSQLIGKYKELTEDNWKTQFGPNPKNTPLESIVVDVDHIQEHLVEIEQLPLI